MSGDEHSRPAAEADGLPFGPAPRRVAVELVGPAARLPMRAYEHDAAYDLCAAEGAVIAPLGRATISTGVILGLPPDLAALTLPRSGLARRHGLSIVNAPGLIDPGYRGEIGIILHNTDPDDAFVVAVGDRIAQLLFVPVTSVNLVAASGLRDADDTQRGASGFGSSGVGGHRRADASVPLGGGDGGEATTSLADGGLTTDASDARADGASHPGS